MTIKLKTLKVENKAMITVNYLICGGKERVSEPL